MQNNILNLDSSNVTSCLRYFWNGYHMECFRNFYSGKSSVLSHGYFGRPWVSHFSLAALPSLWLRLFILLALSLTMCTDPHILIWLFWCHIHMNYIKNDNNKCISDVILSLYEKKNNTSIVVSLQERNQLEIKCLLSPLNECTLFRTEQGQGDLMCIKLN